jgi:hypothetical protein
MPQFFVVVASPQTITELITVMILSCLNLVTLRPASNSPWSKALGFDHGQDGWTRPISNHATVKHLKLQQRPRVDEQTLT